MAATSGQSSDLFREDIIALIGIGGVVLGYVLSELSGFIRRWLERRGHIKAIENELRSNLKIIGDKLDIIRKMRHALAQEKILAGQSVHVLSAAYDSYFATVYEHLTPIQRENLNVIYGQLKSMATLIL
jgi:hypothetical protein